jgi:aryl-alcohol dehydrogenase-like predicted oxidoreductase
MEKRKFGRTGLEVSILGFGCGAVGGLMVRGEPEEQERTIARALEAGVNYFDTAVQYGDGKSESNLGRVLGRLKPAGIAVGTKVRLPSRDFGRIADAITASLDGSLRRLGRERVEILHLHNAVTSAGGGEALSVRQVLDEVAPAFERLRRDGKLRFLGLTAVGETAALRQVIDAGLFDSAQIVYNMLNPSAAAALPDSYPAQDYGRLFDHAQAAGTGIIGIRVLAGGALSGSAERHPVARRRATTAIWRGRGASCRWSRTASPQASPRPRRAFRCRIRRWARSWSAWRRRSSSRTRSPRWKRARCRRRRSGAWPSCGTASPASRAESAAGEDGVGDLLGGHQGREVGVGAGHHRKDRGVDHA